MPDRPKDLNWCPWWHMLLWPPYHHNLHMRRFILTGKP